MSENNQPKLTKNKIKFLEIYGSYDDSRNLQEMLFAQQLQIEKLEAIRSNTSKLVWWLIAIPILIFLFAFIFTGTSMI